MGATEVGVGCARGGGWDARSHEEEPIDQALVAHEPLDNPAHLKVPNDDLGIFAGARDEAIALADVDVGDEIAVAVETRL